MKQWTKWKCSSCENECKVVTDKFIICNISYCPYCGGRNMLMKEVNQ